MHSDQFTPTRIFKSVTVVLARRFRALASRPGNGFILPLPLSMATQQKTNNRAQSTTYFTGLACLRTRSRARARGKESAASRRVQLLLFPSRERCRLDVGMPSGVVVFGAWGWLSPLYDAT